MKKISEIMKIFSYGEREERKIEQIKLFEMYYLGLETEDLERRLILVQSKLDFRKSMANLIIGTIFTTILLGIYTEIYSYLSRSFELYLTSRLNNMELRVVMLIAIIVFIMMIIIIFGILYSLLHEQNKLLKESLIIKKCLNCRVLKEGK